MTIAMFTDAYQPEINGLTTSIALFRAELQRQGHRVYVFCPEYNRPHKEPTDPDVFRLPSIPYFFKEMRERRFVFPSVRKLLHLRKLGVDVIHSHVPGNTGVFALLVSRLFRIPHVHTYHTLYMEYTHYMTLPRAFTTRAVVWISQHYCGRCQWVVAPGSHIARELRKYRVDAPIEIIPTGIDFTRTEELDPPEVVRSWFGLATGEQLLSYVGRIGQEKSLDFLLYVVKHLAAGGRMVKLVIVGDGPERPALEELTRELGLQERVVFTGYIPRRKVFSIYQATEAFVFSSQTETQGLVLLEAMSVGTPVVAIDAMGVSDFQADGRGGFVTPPEVPAFAERVVSLLDDPELRRRKSEEALEKASDWSVERMTHKLLRTYREAIADYRRHGLPHYGDRTVESGQWKESGHWKEPHR